MATARYHLKQHTVARDKVNGGYEVLNEMGEDVYITNSKDDAEEIASLRTLLHQALDALHAIGSGNEVAYLKQNDDDIPATRLEQIEDIASTIHAVICTEI